MSRKKSDKFFIYAAKRNGYWKKRRLLGVNCFYEGGSENVTVQDLVDFLKEKDVELSAVVLNSSFMAEAKV